MFTGLVQDAGECLWLKRTADGTQLTIISRQLAAGARLGDSIAVNGCCLTVTQRQKEHLVFDLLEETLNCTNLRKLRPSAKVNLESSLAANGKIGGHFMQGHVDCTVPVLALERKGADLRLEFALPPQFARYIAPKGSVAVNGVSLTVAALTESSFSVWVIPHTATHTNLGKLIAGDEVNLEFDILAKYAERILRYGGEPATLNV